MSSKNKNEMMRELGVGISFLEKENQNEIMRELGVGICISKRKTKMK